MCATPPSPQGRPAGHVDQGLGVHRPVGLLVEDGHVLEEPQQVDLLLVVHAHEVVIRLTGDGQHRRPVHLGVVEAVEQVDRPRAAGGDADAQPPGVLGVGARVERGGLLVADLDEPDPVFDHPEAFHEPVDPVAGQAEDRVDSPVRQPIEQHVRRGLRHHAPSCIRIAPRLDGEGNSPLHVPFHRNVAASPARPAPAGRKAGGRGGSPAGGVQGFRTTLMQLSFLSRKVL